MNIKDFSLQSANFLADMLAENRFDLDDENRFYKIPTPVVVGGIQFTIYSYKSLSKFRINKDRTEEVLFTFFIARADKEEKDKFLQEIEKQKTGLPTDQSVFDRYVNAFSPNNEDYINLCDQLKVILEQNVYAGKGFEFSLLFTAPDGNLDPAVVFLDQTSVNKLNNLDLEKIVFDPTLD
jgi:hypothetical protein